MALDAILPQQCFACGAGSGGEVLCDDCCAALPGRARARCPVCAIETPFGQVCGACLRAPPPFEASRAALDYAFPVDRMVQALKYGHRLALSRLFVGLMAAAPRPEADLVVRGRHDVKPVHAKAADAQDALHAARAAEVTSLWRLAAA